METREKSLADLLGSLFSQEELRRWVDSDADLKQVLREIEQRPSDNQFFAELVKVGQRRRIFDGEFFTRLSLERPRAKSEIADVARQWGVAGAGGSAPAEAPALSAPPGVAPWSLEYRPTWIPYPSKGDSMVGRAEGIARVRQQLQAGKPTSIGQAAAFTGLGGIGKTQLAVEYAFAHGDDYPGGVIWLVADQDIERQLVQLSEDSRWAAPNELSSHKLALAKRKLKEVKQALFVFDNVLDASALAPWMPRASQRCHTLITSRRDQPGFAPLIVDLLSPDAALQMLVQESARSPEGDELAAARQICADLERLPLAIELSGAWLQYRRTTFREYLQRLAQKGVELEALRSGDSGNPAAVHDAPVDRTLALSLEALRPSADLERALWVLAWSGSGGMGRPLLEAMVTPTDPVAFHDELDLAHTVRVLIEETAPPGADAPRFRLHRLVADLLRRRRPVGEDRPMLEATVDRLGDWFQDRRTQARHLRSFEAEQEHLEAWRDHLLKLEDRIRAARLQWLRAYPLWHRAVFDGARQEIEQALTLAQMAGADAPLLAHILSDLGVVWGNLHYHRKARQHVLQALELRRGLGMGDNGELARSLANAGGAYVDTGQAPTGVRLAEEGVEMTRRVYGDHDHEYYLSMFTLADVYITVSRYKDALHAGERAVMVLQNLGVKDDDPDMIRARSKVAAALDSLERHDEALRLLDEIHSTALPTYGEGSPIVRVCKANLGCCYFRAKDWPKAVECLCAAVLPVMGAVGLDPLVAPLYVSTLARAHMALGQYPKVDELIQRIVRRLPHDSEWLPELLALHRKLLPGFRPPTLPSAKTTKPSKPRR